MQAPTLPKNGTDEQKEKSANLLKVSGLIFTCVVEVTGLEPATAWSQTRNATNCATPRLRFAAAKVQKSWELNVKS